MSHTGTDRESAAGWQFRYGAEPTDVEWIRQVAERVGVFSGSEVLLAAELATERLARGPASGYEFVFAQVDDRLAGYTCYGLIPATVGRYDLYWIVVDPSCRHLGVGAALLAETEHRVRIAGGSRLYAETSGRDRYAPARAFYLRSGFRCEAVLADFYADGDDKVVYLKTLGPA